MAFLDVVILPCSRSDGLSWRRHQFALRTLWVVTSIFQFLTSLTLDVVTLKLVMSSPSVIFKVFWDFVVFRTFSLRKRPKMLLLWFSPQKCLKWEKKRLWVKSKPKTYELGLKPTPKNVTFFVSSKTRPNPNPLTSNAIIVPCYYYYY